MSSVKLVRCWPDASRHIADAALAMWVDNKILTEKVARERAHQLAVVAMDGGTAVGVATVTVVESDRLGVPMFNYRTFVAPDHRQARLPRDLFAETFAHLGAWTAAHPGEGGLGLLTIDQSGKWNQNTEFAMPVVQLPHLDGADMVYLGLSAKGYRVNAVWFPASRLPTALGVGPGEPATG